MKNSTYILALVIILVLTSCITIGPSRKLEGKWQDVENPYFEIEFTDNYMYIEYWDGKQISYGEVYPVDIETIQINYLSPCGGENQVSCDMRLRYTVTDETLIITDNQGDLVFKRVR